MNTIQKILADKYGVGVVSADWTTVTWAVATIEKEFGAVEAAKQLKKVNRIRSNHGVYSNIPSYGTELFKAYFAK